MWRLQPHDMLYTACCAGHCLAFVVRLSHNAALEAWFVPQHELLCPLMAAFRVGSICAQAAAQAQIKAVVL